MVNGHAEESAQWKNELRLGMHRSIAYFRIKLADPSELSQVDRQGITDLLDLLEDYMRMTWPDEVIRAK
jgi:hypothetical protein